MKSQKMSRELPLQSLWEKIGCEWAAEKNWRLPKDFQGPKIEYAAVEKSAGIVDYSFRGKLRVTGSERTLFLNNILTNDIASLAPGQGCYACLLTATGKILGDMAVYIFEDSILLETEMSYEKILLERLTKHLIAEDVVFEDVTDQSMLLAFQGPKADAALGQLGISGPLPEEAFAHRQFEAGGISGHLVRQSWLGKDGWHLWIPVRHAASIAPLLGTCIRDGKVTPVGFQTKETLRIEAGILRYGTDTSEETLLPETGLESFAASETKGCYPGQEVVAKIKTYGGLKRKFVKILLKENVVPMASASIHSQNTPGTPIGRVTSCCHSPKWGNILCLASVSKTAVENETEVKIEAPGRNITGELLPLKD